MAWNYHDGAHMLMVSINGGTPTKLENIVSPRLGESPLTAYSTFLANPYYNGILIDEGYTNWGSTRLQKYQKLDALTTGTIALNSLLDVGDTAIIYRKEAGTDTRIEVSRPTTYQYVIYLYYNNTKINHDYGYNTNDTQRPFRIVSIGFLQNSDTFKFSMYCLLLVAPFNSGSHGDCIVEYIGHANAPDNTTVAMIENVLTVLLFNNVQPTDPYADGGTSTGTTTGTGTFDDTSESVPLPTTYALSATAAGIMSQYVLTEANLAAFGSWLWNGGTIVDDLKHFFQSPMEAIFSVGILPFTPSDTTPYNVYVGALAATGVQGGRVNDTVEKISCGSIDFDGYYGGALDYNPYTKIELFLPYCGTLNLNPDEVMGHTISIDYYCDTITGDCVAFVSDEERVLHQVRGNCFVQIPLAARDFTALYSSAIAAIGTIAAGLATAASGGLSAPVAVGMGTSMAANAMNAKTHIARAGGVSGMAGFMSIQKPYVIMTIPNQCLPELNADFQGYPLFVTKRLGDFSGFTKVYEIHLDGLDCTDAEAKEIYELLKGGVIL